jgi:hypothetical protein
VKSFYTPMAVSYTACSLFYYTVLPLPFVLLSRNLIRRLEAGIVHSFQLWTAIRDSHATPTARARTVCSLSLLCDTAPAAILLLPTLARAASRYIHGYYILRAACSLGRGCLADTGPVTAISTFLEPHAALRRGINRACWARRHTRRSTRAQLW